MGPRVVEEAETAPSGLFNRACSLVQVRTVGPRTDNEMVQYSWPPTVTPFAAGPQSQLYQSLTLMTRKGLLYNCAGALRLTSLLAAPPIRLPQMIGVAMVLEEFRGSGGSAKPSEIAKSATIDGPCSRDKRSNLGGQAKGLTPGRGAQLRRRPARLTQFLGAEVQRVTAETWAELLLTTLVLGSTKPLG